ncbi:MAG: CHAT domain-containing protein [Bacteroidota bacterium]
MKKLSLFYIALGSFFLLLPNQGKSYDPKPDLRKFDSLKNVLQGEILHPLEAFSALYDLGINFAYYKGDLPLSTESFLDAIQLIDQFTDAIPIHKQIGAYKNYGRVLILSERTQEGLQVFEKGWQLILRHKEDFEDAHAYREFLNFKSNFLYTWAKFLNKISSDTYQALEVGEETMRIYQLYWSILSPEDKPGGSFNYVVAWDLMGRMYVQTQQLAKADSAFQHAVDLLEKYTNNSWRETKLKGEILLNKAGSFQEAQNFAKAIKLYTESQREFLSIEADEEILSTLLKISNNLGIIYKKNGEYPKAEFYYSQALSYLPNDPQQTAMVHDNWGDLYFVQKKYPQALEMYHKVLVADLHMESLNLWDAPSVTPDFSQTPMRYYLKSVGSKARTLTQLSRASTDSSTFLLNLAKEHFDYALRLIDSLQSSTQTRDFHFFLKEEVYTVYEGAIEAALLLDDPTLAFQYASQAKAVFLLSSLNLPNPTTFLDVDREILKEEQHIRQKITQFELHDQKDSLISYRLRLDKIIQRLSQIPQYQRYYAARFKQNQCIIADVQAQLPLGTSIVQYFVGSSTSYAFHLTHDHLEVIPINYDEQLVREYLDVFYQKKGLSDKVTDFNQMFQALSHSLYQELLGGFTLPIQQDVIMIPDGALSYIPFETLIQSPIAEANVNPEIPLNYVLRNHQMSTHFSVCAWLSGRTKALPLHHSPRMLAFAPTFQGYSKEEIPPEARGYLYHPLFTPMFKEKQSWYELQNEAEVSMLSDLLQLDAYTHQMGLLGRFLEIAPAYDIIHLATHGQYSDQLPLKNRLLFTIVTDSTDNENLYADMLYSIQLQASMVVMSACQTQLGDIKRGEGITSMAFAFAYAGARSTVGTLWKVNQQSNMQIMQYFYENLKAGQDKAEALRNAKLAYIDQGGNVHPYFWAGPVITGDTQAIRWETNYTKEWSMGIALLMILMIFAYSYRRNLKAKETKRSFKIE